MFFRIHHRLSYAYDRAVFLEPMTLRLTPRQDGTQRILEHHLRLEEPATGLTRVLEPDGNDAMVAWFQNERDRLVIEVDMLVETLRSNPFDWIVTHPEAQHLPVTYPPAEARSLAGLPWGSDRSRGARLGPGHRRPGRGFGHSLPERPGRRDSPWLPPRGPAGGGAHPGH